jgi:hypothetical protein
MRADEARQAILTGGVGWVKNSASMGNTKSSVPPPLPRRSKTKPDRIDALVIESGRWGKPDLARYPSVNILLSQ